VILVGETPDPSRIPSGCRFHPRCPVAFERCPLEDPPLFDLGGGHRAACLLVEDGRGGSAATRAAVADGEGVATG
jgi:peptide/nickel transport system ATP-binding protein